MDDARLSIDCARVYIENALNWLSVRNPRSSRERLEDAVSHLESAIERLRSQE